MHRRTFLAAFVTAAGIASTTVAQDPRLEDTLRFGLRARRPIEMRFVAEIAELTNNGDLPKDFILAIFDYSRKRRPKFPLPYFEFVVREKAAALGVSINTPPILTNN